MDDHITFSRDLQRRGLSPGEVRRLVRVGEISPIRRGAYRSGPRSEEADARRRHRELIEATVPLCGSDLVVSHMSAAVIHGLPIWPSDLDRVQFTRDGAGHGNSRRLVRVHGLPLAADEIVVVDGIVATSLARTVLDLACQLPMDRAVAVGDAALRLGVRPADFDPLLDRAGRRHGIGAARRAIAFLDARSETVGESRSRVVFHLNGIPAPEPQFYIYGPDGRFVARTDFGWAELRTVGEFDGLVKYQRKLRPGHDPEQELFKEKRREDAVRDLRFQVVRWLTSDIDRPLDLLARLRRAFERGRRDR